MSISRVGQYFKHYNGPLSTYYVCMVCGEHVRHPEDELCACYPECEVCEERYPEAGLIDGVCESCTEKQERQ